MVTIGDRIKERRLELGLTQTDLAKRMGYKTKSTICEMEQPGSNITTNRLERVAEALGVSVFYLLGTDESELNFISDDEELLLEHYRKSDEQTKEMVRRLLCYYEGLKK